MKEIIIASIRFYRNFISVFLRQVLGLGSGCRYEMTCSVYAERAIQKHGVVKGSVFSLKRILSCRPMSKKQYATI